MKFAAIDIGSNAIRLLLSHVYDDGTIVKFTKAELIRIPIRLGEDAFLKGKISKDKSDKLISAMKAFKHLIDVYAPVDYRACATSAMRDAANGLKIIKKIKKEAKLKVEIIDGKTEANIIFSNHIEQYLDHTKSYLYIDIGGGSTELTLFSNNKIIASQSFNIGTIRLLHQQINHHLWQQLTSWITKYIPPNQHLIAIGSGGNINKLHKMLIQKKNKNVSTQHIQEMYQTLSSYTYQQRITELSLNPDRADVIVPASQILLKVLQTANINEMICPQIGLADGIIHQLYDQYKLKKKYKTSLFY